MMNDDDLYFTVEQGGTLGSSMFDLSSIPLISTLILYFSVHFTVDSNHKSYTKFDIMNPARYQCSENAF